MVQENFSGDKISELVHKLSLKCINRDEQIRGKQDLSPSEYRAVLALEPGEVLSATLFADKLHLSVSRSSRVINKLEQDGYIKVIKSSLDKRSISITLTEKGAESRYRIISNKESCNSKLDDSLSSDERALIYSGLTKLLDLI
jgi:DNA-binding MarR family transcriptional regulator